MIRPSPFRITLIAILLIICSAATGQVSCIPVFTKQYQSTGDLMPCAVKELPDGSFLAAGKGRANTASSFDGMVTKFSSNGVIQWSYAIGGAGDDAFTGITLLSDGSYLLYGTTSSFSYNVGKAWLVQISNTGTLLWSWQIGKASMGKDVLKAVQQFSDGDIIGTFNTDDSTAASNAVVFKMALDGTLKWSQSFDNGDNDSFTSLAFSGNTIYAAGFYTMTTVRAVIVLLNSTNGSLIESKTISQRDNTHDHQVSNIEVANNAITYGLYIRKKLIPNSSDFTAHMMIKTDLNFNTLYSFFQDNSGDSILITSQRAADDGYLVLRGKRGRNMPAAVNKISLNGTLSFGNLLTDYNILTHNSSGLDATRDGGCIVAGYNWQYFGGAIMTLQRTNTFGESGPCKRNVASWGAQTATFNQQAFTWTNQSAFLATVQTATTPVSTPLNVTQVWGCEYTQCVDRTPLPPGCLQTYNLQYTAQQMSTLRDAVTTPDGGKMVVGDNLLKALIVKYKENGDLDWAKAYQTPSTSRFMRITKTRDGNYLVWGNSYNGSAKSILMKIDVAGNVLWWREIQTSISPDLLDVSETPDGGWVVLFQNSYGGGISSYGFAIRFDAQANVIWQKQFSGNVSHVYNKVYCHNDAVFLSYRSIGSQAQSLVGIEKLNLATGNRVWSNYYSNGGNNTEVVDRVYAIEDTVYVFMTHYEPVSLFNYKISPVLMTLNPDGTVARAIQMQGDNMVTNYTAANWFDAEWRTATLTPDNDFVQASCVAAGTDTLLRLTRFDKYGNVSWSATYPDTYMYQPFNIEMQGKGIHVMGNSRRRNNNLYYSLPSLAFFFKVDSAGQIKSGATGCNRNNAQVTFTPINFFIKDYARQHTVTDHPYYQMTSGTIASRDFDIDPTLICSTPAICATATLKQRGTGCSASDTLTFFLDNNVNCDAAATWQYDPAFFKNVFMNGDSIRLLPKQPGAYMVSAAIEGSCLTSNQSIASAVGIAASQVSSGPDTIWCKGQTIKIGATPGYNTYTWNDGSIDDSLSITTPGKYYVTVTDNCGGTGSDTVLVTDAGLVFRISGNTTKCNNDTISLQASSGYNNYQWTPSVNIKAINHTALVSPDTDTRYYVTAEQWAGCNVIDSILITTLSSPALQLCADTSLCIGDSVEINAATGFNSYLWSNGQTSNTITVKTSGRFSLTATYNNGCQSKDTFNLVYLYRTPQPDLGQNALLCSGTTRVLQPTQNFSTYAWSDGSNGPSMQVSAVGTYYVDVVDQRGCKGSDTLHITAIAPLPANFLPADTAICQYGKLTIIPVNQYNDYHWNDFSMSQSLTIQQPGMYWLTVTDQNNCEGRDSIFVTGKQCMVGLYVPNAFTPNGDGKNEVFKPLLFGNATSYTFTIFNRWGGKVYETQTPNEGWNGRINAGLANNGTYVWTCRYTLEGQPAQFEKGIMQLIR